MANFVDYVKNRKDIQSVSNALHARLKYPYPERIDEVHIDEEGKTVPGIIFGILFLWFRTSPTCSS